ARRKRPSELSRRASKQKYSLISEWLDTLVASNARLVRLLRRLELAIDDDRSARNLFLADPERPHRQPVLVMGAARCFPDRHELVERFENADRSGYVSVPDLALL